MIPLDNPLQTADDCPAVRIGIRVCDKGEQPRESFGVVTSGIRSKSFVGYLMLCSPPGAATAQVFSGLSRIWTVARGAIVRGRFPPLPLRKAKWLADCAAFPQTLMRAGVSQNRVSGRVGACRKVRMTNRFGQR